MDQIGLLRRLGIGLVTVGKPQYFHPQPEFFTDFVVVVAETLRDQRRVGLAVNPLVDVVEKHRNAEIGEQAQLFPRNIHAVGTCPDKVFDIGIGGIIRPAPGRPNGTAEPEAAVVAAAVGHHKRMVRDITRGGDAVQMAEFPVVDPPGIDQAPDEGVSRDIGIVAGKCKREMFVVFEGCEAQRNVVRGHPVRKREPQPYDIAGTPGTAQAEGGGNRRIRGGTVDSTRKTDSIYVLPGIVGLFPEPDVETGTERGGHTDLFRPRQRSDLLGLCPSVGSDIRCLKGEQCGQVGTAVETVSQRRGVGIGRLRLFRDTDTSHDECSSE